MLYIIGHIHLIHAWTAITDDNIRVIIPPAPANEEYTGSFVMFSYDDTKKTLNASEIQIDGTMITVF